MKLNNKVAIVTGSSQNVGKEIAKLFAKEGAKIILVGRNIEKGQGVLKK
jgi:NAD(P)-dependent dehydrogenase (short-subunit alcohol dehydrogenase family)